MDTTTDTPAAVGGTVTIGRRGVTRYTVGLVESGMATLHARHGFRMIEVKVDRLHVIERHIDEDDDTDVVDEAAENPYGFTDEQRAAFDAGDEDPGAHRCRVFVADRSRGFYSWRCSCGLEGARDLLHREYARDAWREAHGLDPIVNRPLV